MERRDFLRCAAATSVGAMTGTALAGTKDTVSTSQMKKCKVKVVNKLIFQDLYKKHRGSEGKICSAFEEGQEFILDSPWSAPEGFCQFAWADIRMYIMAVCFGNPETTVACCTDGFRPVIFEVGPA